MVRLAAIVDAVNWGDVPPELATPDDLPDVTALQFDE